MRQKSGPFREDSMASQGSGNENRNPHGAIGNDPLNGKGKEGKDSGLPEVQDPMAPLSASEKFGLKGLRHLMNVHPDYNAFLNGVDSSMLGIDLTTNEYALQHATQMNDCETNALTG